MSSSYLSARLTRRLLLTGAAASILLRPRVLHGQTRAFAVDGRTDPLDRVQVEIGDAKQTAFLPQLKLLRWNDEVNLSARLMVDPSGGALTTPGNVIRWDKGIYRCEWYPQPDSQAHPEGGFEFAVTLLARPVSNRVPFSMQAKNALFLYQPPLTLFERQRGNLRPDNIVGSYAVYHVAPPANVPGGMLYRSGKVAHIYRPEAIAANGQRVWCDLSIDAPAGLMTITVPRLFLDTAPYPILIDPTVGYTTLGASTDGTGDFILATSFTAPSAGDANPGTAFVGCKGELGVSELTVMMGAYTGGGANPNGKARLATASPITFTSNVMAFRSSAITWTGITATSYWLSINGDVNIEGIETAYDTGDTTYFYGRVHANDMPDPWGTNTGSFDAKVSVYVEYTAAAADCTGSRLTLMGVGC